MESGAHSSYNQIPMHPVDEEGILSSLIEAYVDDMLVLISASLHFKVLKLALE